MSDRYKRAYLAQKHGAAQRGIGWELTYEEWREWWGDDIHRRGTGHDQLQMQRYADAGPYALWNIKKGCPRDNMRTAGKGRRRNLCDRRRSDIEAALNAAMFAPSAPPLDESEDDGLDRPGWDRSKVFDYGY